MLASASHTHSAPYGFANFPMYNTARSQPSHDRGLSLHQPPAVRRLHRRRSPPTRSSTPSSCTRSPLRCGVPTTTSAPPAPPGGPRGSAKDLTQNRSIEAHLADHGIILKRGAGASDQDPEGVPHHGSRGQRAAGRPAGRRSALGPPRPADALCAHRRGPDRPLVGVRQPRHGHPASFYSTTTTTTPPAVRVFEDEVRRFHKVPGRPVVNVYGNGDEGDQSAGLDAWVPSERTAWGAEALR